MRSAPSGVDERARLGAHRRAAPRRRHDPGRPIRRRAWWCSTCAIRENADNKLYGNLGHLKPLKAANPQMRIVVSGCLAQKDQGEIQRRAPWVDVLRDPRAAAPPGPVGTLGDRGPPDGRTRADGDVPERARRPAMTRSARGSRSRRGATTPARSASCRSCGGRSVPAPSATSWPRSRGSPPGGRRGDPARPEREHVRSRRHGARVLAHSAVRPSPATGGRGRGDPTGSVHQPAPARSHARRHRRHGRDAVRLRTHPLPAAVGVGRRAQAHAVVVPARPLPGLARSHPYGDRRDRRLHRHHRGLPGDRAGLRADARGGGSARFDSAYMFQYLAPSGHEGGGLRGAGPQAGRAGPVRLLVALQERISTDRAAALVGETHEVLVEGGDRKGRSTQSRTRTNRIVHIADVLDPGTFARARIVAAAPHHLTGELVRARVGAAI